MGVNGGNSSRRKDFSHKVYLSQAEDTRIYQFSQHTKIPMGRLFREGALKMIDELEREAT